MELKGPGSCYSEIGGGGGIAQYLKNEGRYVRAACLQNETAPENILNRYEKRFEKCERGSEKRSETRLKNV